MAAAAVVGPVVTAMVGEKRAEAHTEAVLLDWEEAEMEMAEVQ